MNDDQYSQTVDRFGDLIEACVSRAQRQSFDSSDGQQAAAVSLLATILELSKDFLTLIRGRNAVGPKVVLRSLLEAWVELVNLCDDKEYLGFMQAAQLDQQWRVLNTAARSSSSENPFFRDLLANEIRESRQVEIDEAITELAEKGIRPLKIYQRFERAREKARYESVYALLCQQSHHNLGALEGRHMVLHEGRHTVAMFKLVETSQAIAEIDTAAGVVANAVDQVSQLIHGGQKDMDEVARSLADLRSMYSEQEPGESDDG